MRLQIVSTLFFGIAWARYLISNASDPLLTVNTTSGTYTGFVNSTLPNVSQWLGIPFGKPPTGSLRFREAEKAPNYGAQYATSYKPICIQNNDNTSGVFWTLVPEFQNTDPQSEDCLYLNIWAPRTPPVKKGKVPVIVWVCGGGLQEGGGHAPYQVPDRWIERTQTHIVVTFNYRMNVFGFPAAEGAIGNPGLSDVRLVVEWLRDNVESFGGDKGRMVLWGQSAGGNVVDSYSYANPDDPIVSGIIADSGVAPESTITNTSTFSLMARDFGCGNLTAADELSCMQKADALKIQEYVKAYSKGEAGRARLGGYIVDNKTVFANNTERMRQGRVARVPLITGMTQNEGAAFVPFQLNQTVGPNPEELLPSAQRFVCGAYLEATSRATHNLTTYVYLFKGNFSNITPRYWLGAMHSSELPIVFGTHDLFRGNSTDLEFQTSYSMEAMWASFAANPTKAPVDHTGLTWPMYTGVNGSIVTFGDVEKNTSSAKVPASVLNAVYPVESC